MLARQLGRLSLPDPNTFGGNVLAAVAGVLFVAILTRAWDRFGEWRRRTFQVVIHPFIEPTIEQRLNAPFVEIKTPTGRARGGVDGWLHVGVYSRREWSPADVEICFMQKRIRLLPMRFPGNLQRTAPDVISCRRVDVDPRMGGFTHAASGGGWLQESIGCCRTVMNLNDGIVPEGHSIKLSVLCHSRRNFSGVLRTRVRVDAAWLFGHCAVTVPATEER